MSFKKILPFLLIIAAVSPLRAQTPTSAAGTLTVNGEPAKLTQARALQTTDWIIGPNHKMVKVSVIKVVLSDVSIDDVEDDFELGVEGKEGKLHGLRIELNKNGEPMGGNIYTNALETGTSSLLMSHVLFEPNLLNDHTISGKVHADEAVEFDGVKYDFSVTFSTPVVSEPKPSVEGGGAAEMAPAKAVREFLRALSANDAAALKQVLRKEFVEMLGKPEAQEAIMATLSATYPADELKQLKIVRVFDFGNRAWVEGTTKRPNETGGAPTDVTYRIRALLVDGKWKVQPL